MGVLTLAVLLATPGVAGAQSNSYARMLDTTRTLQQNLFDEMNRANAARAPGARRTRVVGDPRRSHSGSRLTCRWR